ILEAELVSLGLTDVRAVGSGAYFSGSLEQAYRVCLWSRVANKVLLPLAEFPAGSPEELYQQVREIDWSRHMNVGDTLAVDFFSANSAITHTQYGALKVKDAIVDQFREASGARPSVDREQPSIRINVYVFRNKARLALDLAGLSLHRRGYRDAATIAPLKENLAAALLYAMDWPALAGQGRSFCDPMCGSGTFLIEAAMMATDCAPQLQRDYFGFIGWKGHQPELWQTLREEARQRFETGLTGCRNRIFGSDKSSKVIEIAKANIARAGFSQLIDVRVDNLEQLRYPSELPPGLVLCNPPYGVRLDNKAAGKIYSTLGRAFRDVFGGWRAGVFTGSPELAHRLRLKTHTRLKCSNGGIDCKLLRLDIPAGSSGRAADQPVAQNPASPQEKSTLSIWRKNDLQAEMFANRLRKNFKSLEKWARSEAIGCYRVYDADLPEYALAIDVYESDQRYVHVQEYRAPASVDKALAAARLQAALAEIPGVLGCAPEAVRLKERRRQSGSNQYEKLGSGGDVHIIEEYGCRFEVNLSDYLDTGIFADHRKIRQWIGKAAGGKRFLNLFAYTGTATVHAVTGGAVASTTVDMSANYLAWAERNLALNTADTGPHEFIRADCLAWLAEPPEGARYDLILLDPPTFSNSTRMEQDWDVQRDHVRLIRQAMRLLDADGLLIFSNNFRKFRLDQDKLDCYLIDNKSRDSIPRDFSRNPKIHQCYFIRHRQ
ncbi:MAG: bifunctional 23S rRNA (guanine(2069)-N(7))-methyltransferase RlmK/23S rRNA (guanine(2445)-N(2))-methyltransferase RlmL, partial [Gammaproteobacteria bacterium]|nr:bifunctional 23S rRNA (guanine(2069)-N(7))-methyltransferase RlmK/23S rRNA (guanine(2445)-N(2))-methyltransferase RlmL [Gammaproteobacteria bacterium]